MTQTSRSVSLATVLVAVFIFVGAVPASAIDMGDDDLFGPGESWSLPETIEPGDSGPWVALLQERLRGGGFRPGVANGQYGANTLSAVYAFQKVHGLPRDGIFHNDYWALLEQEPTLPIPAVDLDRIEVDLDAQVLYVIKAGKIESIVAISSGSGGTYRSRTGLARATTPEGSFRAQRHIGGWRISYLGALYRPYYFRGGYAIHGSYSVPPHPASHGCIRVSLRDMDYLVGEISLGMPIYIYGKRVERSSILPSAPAPPEIPSEVIDLAL